MCRFPYFSNVILDVVSSVQYFLQRMKQASNPRLPSHAIPNGEQQKKKGGACHYFQECSNLTPKHKAVFGK
jgi:hypothetical protein